MTAARLVRIGAINETQAGDLAGESDNFTNTMTISPSFTFSETMLEAQVMFGLSTSVEKASLYFNLSGYGEFAAENRPAGWDVRLNLALSPKSSHRQTWTARACSRQQGSALLGQDDIMRACERPWDRRMG